MTNETWERVEAICATLKRKRDCQDASATFDSTGIRFVIKAQDVFYFIQWSAGDVSRFAPKTMAGFLWDEVEYRKANNESA